MKGRRLLYIAVPAVVLGSTLVCGHGSCELGRCTSVQWDDPSTLDSAMGRWPISAQNSVVRLPTECTVTVGCDGDHFPSWL